MPAARTARHLLIAGVVSALLLLSACGNDSSGPAASLPVLPSGSSSGSPAPTPSSAEPSASGPSEPPAPTAPDPSKDLYVALGDSFVSAPLVPQTNMTEGCLRSNQNYPHLVVAERDDFSLVDVSCSGATSTAMIGAQVIGDQPKLPQFDALDEDVDLVTIGIGGNDFSLFATMMFSCLQIAAADPEGAPCREANKLPGGGDKLLQQVSAIEDRIEAIVLGIKDRAPNAQVIVVNYPQFLPDDGICRDLVPLAAGDYDYVSEVNKALSGALDGGAKSGGAELIDVYAASKGHDVCSEAPWVNGIETDPSRALAFHPFAEEQRAVADLILRRL